MLQSRKERYNRAVAEMATPAKLQKKVRALQSHVAGHRV
jgi:hypothetical protein